MYYLATLFGINALKVKKMFIRTKNETF